MKSSDKLTEQGRAIAQGMQQIKVEQKKNMAKADKRKQTMLENAAEIALSGNGGAI